MSEPEPPENNSGEPPGDSLRIEQLSVADQDGGMDEVSAQKADKQKGEAVSITLG